MKIISKIFLTFVILFLSIIAYSQQISINEIMSSNETFLKDKDNEYSDWIELYNNENQAINLQDFSITDDIVDLNKWTFPSVTIPAKGFLLIFASAKNSQDTTELHTNFKIKQSGEAIYLIQSNQVISSVLATPIPTNTSYGSIQNGNNLYTHFDNPTPNATNKNSQSIYASHHSGFYHSEFLLTMIPSDSTQTIYYTLNGKVPSTNDKRYISPLLIQNNTNQPNSISDIPTTPGDYGYHWKQPENVYKNNVIRYALFENDSMISPIYSKTYFIDVKIDSRYTFPIISLVTDSLNLFDYETGVYIPGKRFDDLGYGAHPFGNYNIQGQEGERPIHITYFEPNGDLVFETNAGVRMRGQGSASYPQKSFNIYFKEEYGIKEIEYPIFKNTAVNKRIILRNSGQDVINTHFKDALLQSLLAPLEMELQDFQPSILFINGEYWGIYNLREKYDRFYFKNRYDIAEDNINILDPCGYAEYGNHDDYQNVIDYIYNNDLQDDIHYEYVSNKIDIDNYINFQIAEIYYAHYDWPCNNYKIWKTNDVDSKWRFMIYDLDLSFMHNQATHFDSLGMSHATFLANNWPFCECSNILFVKLLKNEQFKTQFVNTFESHLKTIFDVETVLDKIDEFEQLLQPEIEEHIERWKYPSSLSVWYDEITELKTYAINRPCFTKNDLITYFDLETFDFECVKKDSIAQKSQIIFYPNPNQGQLFIKNNTPNINLIGDISLTTVYGQTILFQKNVVLLNNESINLKLSSLPNGVYFVRFQTVDFSVIEKVIVER